MLLFFKCDFTWREIYWAQTSTCSLGKHTSAKTESQLSIRCQSEQLSEKVPHINVDNIEILGLGPLDPCDMSF